MKVTHVTYGSWAPHYFEAVVSPRKLTLRSFVEEPRAIKEEIIERPDFLRQQAEEPAWDFKRVFFYGEHLDERLTGKIMLFAGQAVLDLDSPDIAAEVSDHACWVFFLNGSELQAPYNRFAATSGSRVSVKAHGERAMRRRVLTIWQRFAGDSFDDMAFHLYHHEDAFFVGLPESMPGTPQINFHETLPTLRLSAPTHVNVGGDAAVAVQLVETDGTPIKKDCTVYLEALSGYLPKTRVAVKDGGGSFRVLPLGLEAGDKITVRTGFKFVSSLASVEIPVV